MTIALSRREFVAAGMQVGAWGKKRACGKTFPVLVMLLLAPCVSAVEPTALPAGWTDKVPVARDRGNTLWRYDGKPVKTPKQGNPGRLRMALVNLKSLYSDGPSDAANRASVQANLKRHLYFIDKAAAEGAEFVGFPELSLSGYHFSNNMTWLSLDGPEVKALREKAAEKGVYLSGGIAEKDANGKKWNTHFVIDPTGRIIGPDGQTLAQMPSSSDRGESKEFILVYDVPVPAR